MYEAITLLVLTVSVFIVPAWRRFFFFPETPGVPQENEKQTSERYTSPDILRGIAVVAVIVIHVLYLLSKETSVSSETAVNIMNDLLRFAVPVFFITSGALVSRKNSWRKFYAKKIIRILVPYSLCVLAISLYYGWGIVLSLWHWVAGTASVPYWFIPVLFQLYLLYPILVRYEHSSLFLSVTFLLSLLGATILPLRYGATNISTVLAFVYLFAFGMRYRHEILNPRQDIKKAWLFATLFGLYVMCVCVFPSWYYNAQLIMGPAFVILVSFCLPRKKEHAVLSMVAWIGSQSLWVYLTHFLIVFLTTTLVFPLLSSTLFRLIISSFIAVPLSILFGWICQWIYKKMFAWST